MRKIIPIDITLDMCIEELERRKKYFKEKYPILVEKHKISPYERDDAIAANKKLLSLLNEAKAGRHFGGPTFIELLDRMPVANDTVTTEITIDMCITELQLQTKYCKGQRSKINCKLLSLLANAKGKR